MAKVCGRETGWPAEFEMIRRWYEPHLERNHEDAAIRHGDVLQMESIASTYPTRERFLTELTLDPPDATSDESGVPLIDEDYLILSTIHSAKGQEWRNVFVLNGVDGCIPSDLGTGSDEEIDEERRLLYVAMTRAKEDLHIVTPQRFYVHNQTHLGDRHVWASRTRFIPAQLMDAVRSGGVAAGAGRRRAHGGGAGGGGEGEDRYRGAAQGDVGVSVAADGSALRRTRSAAAPSATGAKMLRSQLAKRVKPS